MGTWVRKWRITITWERAAYSPLGIASYTTHVDTVDDLHELVEYARADPNVTSLPHETVRMVEGSAPTHCANGHTHHDRTPGARAASRAREVQCSCGGHLILVCRRCGDETADPPWKEDCDPSRPAGGSGRVPPSMRIESPSPPTLLVWLRRQEGQPPTGSHS